MLLTDIPYLEPMWLWLRDDETLKRHFTEHSFFMPHHDLVEAAERAMRKECPAPRALWILPQDTQAQTQREGCKSPGIHTFYITIIVQCMRDVFQIANRAGSLKLEGQYMELSEIRRHVKDSVNAFYVDYRKKGGQRFSGMSWVKDQMLYPTEDEGVRFLATALEYRVTIF